MWYMANKSMNIYPPHTKRAFTYMCLHICVTSQCPKINMMRSKHDEITPEGHPNSLENIRLNFEDFDDNHTLLHYV